MDDEKNLFDLLRRIIEAEGYTGDPKITIKSGSEIGDGFLSNNHAVEIQQGENATLKLFVKAATKNEAMRSQIKSGDLFAREIYFYETIHPTFLKFQTERNVKEPFDSVPKCYLTSGEVLIFENLKEQGYTMYNRKVEANAIIKSAFELYARFHAVSYTMKDQEPFQYAKFIDNIDDLNWPLLKSSGVDATLARYCEQAKTLFDLVQDPHISKRIKNLTDILMNTVSNSGQSIDEYSVIVHGDAWYNNFLFKYKDDHITLEDARVLDWQLMRLNSPVLDLSYFFYATATKTNLDKLDFYLKTYHETLSRNITEMGSEPDKLYPYEVFRNHWKKFSKFGLLMSLGMQKVILMEKGEMPDAVEAVESGKKFGEAYLLPPIRNEDLYRERIRDIVQHFVDNDFI